jgi:hypothetical protein
LIACQLRLSTSTMFLFRMSDINYSGVMENWSVGLLCPNTPALHYSNPDAGVCSLLKWQGGQSVARRERAVGFAAAGIE